MIILRGQTSIEFLMATAVALLFFTVMLAFYFVGQNDISTMSRAVEARRICNEVSAQIATVTASGKGANAAFLEPRTSAFEVYEVHITGGTGAVSVNYENRGASCLTGIMNITNSTSLPVPSSFRLYGTNDTAERNFSIINTGEGIVIG